ncbi:cobalt-zinc-cadmium efflux system protein [Saccharicrinis carchari]|uniref:Cobalt-zinc-cadmium efflux system protein n=1 Tax=Saccharicrinis carchari TaxID=1168039 RepID=A0A521D346_SACCC|nr:cation diffusion facilitator family transporter [Saccharicrinis carchari]SMO66113.1 cobalt-zinc-cadmium efflux system protein [Saccharicrinis carchari]
MGHTHEHSHHGHHHPELKGKNLFLAILLNVLITVAQVVGAIFSHSLSLMTDALHNLSDVMALGLSYVANRLARRKPTQKQSFGYKRAEILAAFINASTLLGISLYLIIEAAERLFTSKSVEVGGELVMWLAGLSIVANGLSVLLIQKDAKNSMNMRAAYLHLFSDMLTSIAVLIGGYLMSRFAWFWVDSLLSVGIAVYLIVSSWSLVVGALRVLMQFTPKGIDLDKITERIGKVTGVKNIHHVHVWQLTDHEIHFEAHVDCADDLKISEVDKVLNEIREILEHDFNIHHSTLQPEFRVCDDKSLIANG